MRNNFEEKLEQLKNNSNKDPIPKISNENQIFDFPNSTQMVDIPSKGKFYPEEHPLKNKPFIEIKEMTAKEEDILTNKSYLKKGILINKLIESLLVDKSIDVSTLLVGDKNAIMVAARINAYGASYDVTLDCTECGHRNLVNIDLNKISVRETPENLQDFKNGEINGADQLQNGNILLVLPRTKWVAECKLMNGKDEKLIVSLLESKKNKEDSDITISEQLKIIISSINSVTDTEILERAIDAMPAYDAKALRTAYQKLIPNVVIEKNYICSSCEKEQELEVPFTQEFFWPK